MISAPSFIFKNLKYEGITETSELKNLDGNYSMYVMGIKRHVVDSASKKAFDQALCIALMSPRKLTLEKLQALDHEKRIGGLDIVDGKIKSMQIHKIWTDAIERLEVKEVFLGSNWLNHNIEVSSYFPEGYNNIARMTFRNWETFQKQSNESMKPVKQPKRKKNCILS